MAETFSVDLNNPAENKRFTEAGGNAKYAMTMGSFKDPTTGQMLNAVGAGGSVAIPWIETGSFEGLPPEIKKSLVGTAGAFTGYNPYKNVVGYALDPKTGQVILKSSAQGGQSFPSAYMSKDASGNLVSNPGAAVSGSSSTASGATTASLGTAIDPNKMARQSAFDFLFEQFNQYGLGALVEDIKGLVESNVSPSEFTIRLRQTPAYKKRFAANDARINKGLRALSEGEYIALEDQYQNVMRNYGLPASYYTKGDLGVQQGFEKFIAGDVSAAELEDRIQTAQNRVINAAPEVSRALREFYPDISNSDILAYALDPEQALTNIKRKVTAAEIGGAALQAGLATGLSRAEELQRYGVTGEQARQGYQAISGLLPRASQLGDIYAKQGMGPFTQTTAEAEVFGTPGAADAAMKRRKLTELEQAQFSGQTGVGALARERAGQF